MSTLHFQSDINEAINWLSSTPLYNSGHRRTAATAALDVFQFQSSAFIRIVFLFSRISRPMPVSTCCILTRVIEEYTQGTREQKMWDRKAAGADSIWTLEEALLLTAQQSVSPPWFWLPAMTSHLITRDNYHHYTIPVPYCLYSSYTLIPIIKHQGVLHVYLYIDLKRRPPFLIGTYTIPIWVVKMG